MLKDDFLHYLSAERNYSAATIREYNQVLSAFSEYIRKQGGKDIDWRTIADGDIREWVVLLMNQGSAASSANTRLSVLRSFYKYLLAYGYVSLDPTRLIEGPKKSKPLPNFIKESEMDRLLDHTPFPQTYEGFRDHLMLLTFYSTGIRLAELVGLNEDDVDFGAMTLKVTGKRDKQRIIPFGNELKEEMQKFQQERNEKFPVIDTKALFVSLKGVRMTPPAVRDIVKYYLGLVTTQKKRSPHVLRHSFATAMLNHGAEIEVVKELLGHESLSTTEIYTHTTFEELKKIYNHAHPRA
ncbi:MAG: tyrosine-type recombinase/integrase [Bacteroidaceae bacterium]|jgi:integrase/recombinase XerC|nr:tyrosine-type recombinase/integrase [Bacteroidaceae bacterium]